MNNQNSNKKSSDVSKIFILDTNVILHDYRSIKHFQDNDIVIPVAVLEELDSFKKGNGSLNFNARGFMRTIDNLTRDKMFGKRGIPIGDGMGYIKIEPNHPFPEEMKDLFMDDIQDHRILSTAIWIRDHNPDKTVALVTKDINLRLKSKAVGMRAEDYLTDRIEDNKLEISEKEMEYINDVPAELLQELCYGPNNSFSYKKLFETEPAPNCMFRFKWQNDKSGTTVCARYNVKRKQIELVRNLNAYGIKPRNDEQKFAMDACMNNNIRLVSLTGGAGTGKTLIALASAMEQVRHYEQIILTRPAIVLGNQDIGFLPGDEKKKMMPFIQPLMDNLNVIKSQFRPNSREYNKIEAMLKDEKLVISPLAYIRGRSLGKMFCIIDEAQNLTPHEVKTIITRAGENTKMVFTGDIFQIDQPYLDQWSNGLAHLGDKMAGQDLFQHVSLRKGERSRLSDIASRLL